MILTTGTKLGPYEILEPLGQGGMGEVYKARDTRLKRDVAIKVLSEAWSREPDRIARFQREAELLATLNHPNIAAVYGFEEAPAASGIVLEFVDGETLADRIAHGSLPIPEALGIARQIADALEAAHEKGVVHRDLKPANVKVTPDGQVKVLDFGLAKMLEPEGAAGSPGYAATMSPTLSLQATYAGMILGTAAYMSPEQARGKPVDRRADIWAFGCVLYEMLTGRRTFEVGETLSDAVAAVLRSEPDWTALPADTPASIRTLLRRCLEKDPKRRLRDIADARMEIEDALGGGLASNASAPAPARMPRRHLIGLATACLVAGAALAAAVAWAVVRFSPAPKLQPVRFGIVTPSPQSLAPTGADRQLTISADGTHLVYIVGPDANQGQLMVRRIDRLEAEPVRGITAARGPFLSPDGKWIGFFQDSQIKKVSILGGPAVTLAPISAPPRGASWGPDDTIVFATTVGTGLFSVPAGGGVPKSLTTPDRAHGEFVHVLPSVLPDGHAVLFTIPRGSLAAAQIAALDVKTGRYKTLINGGSQAQYVDTGHLVYAAGGTLRAVRFDPVKLEVLSDPVPVVEQVATSGTGAAQFSVSRTGTLVYAPGRGAGVGTRRSLLWVTRQGREEPVAAPERAYLALRLSPDGTRVAVDVRDQEQDIWIWDFARRTPTRLTFDAANDIYPVWTPDSRRIVFSSARNGNVLHLLWQMADGTGTAEVLATADRPVIANAFTPDATKLLVFMASGGGGDIGVVDLPRTSGAAPAPASGKAALLVETMFAERNADISPDGHWMAYESNESGQFQVIVRPFPNVEGGRWQISTAGGTNPVWAANGRELFYVDGGGFLTTVPVQTTPGFSPGNPTRLLNNRYFFSSGVGRPFDVSRDGQRFLMIKDAAGAEPPSEQSASMIVVVNWFDELKARTAQ